MLISRLLAFWCSFCARRFGCTEIRSPPPRLQGYIHGRGFGSHRGAAARGRGAGSGWGNERRRARGVPRRAQGWAPHPRRPARVPWAQARGSRGGAVAERGADAGPSAEPGRRRRRERARAEVRIAPSRTVAGHRHRVHSCHAMTRVPNSTNKPHLFQISPGARARRRPP